MSEQSTPRASKTTSRREFLRQGTTAVVAGSVAAALAPRAFAAGSETIRVGLVGCGGRGTGAAAQALRADGNTKLVAVADAFADQLERSQRSLKAQDFADRVVADKDHQFVGFDGYKGVIDASDVVLLATPPHFRPAHLRAAIEAGKHVFCEKPVAVDAPGVRSVLETTELAKKKGLTIVSGLCWRYDFGMREMLAQIHGGTLGEVLAMQCSYNSNGVWEPRRTREQCDSDMEYQMRNWYYYTWLSGDFNVEQHIHSLDKMAWVMRDEPPVRASGSGGRIQRTDPRYGNIYDHFSIVYEYANGVKAFCRCRHFLKSDNDVSDHVFGTKGRANLMRYRIEDVSGNPAWRYRGRKNVMHQTEHDDMFAALRAGKTINNGVYMANSTMMAIMGRMVAYTGKTLTWDEVMGSKEDLTPPKYEWGPLETPAVAIPGFTPFV